MSARAPRAILHADMDAFYASIEQRDRPELRGLPVVVGGTSGRGVVSAASYEARRYGIHSAMPTAQARKLCPDAIFLPGRMGVYQTESARLVEIFGRFTPAVERVSLDEAFLDLTGTEALLGPPLETAKRLRETVRAETGLPVSVGMGPVKLVAKIASDLAKPDGLLAVDPGAVRAFLDPLPVGRIWGIGPVAARRLNAAGIERIGQLAACPPPRLRELLGSFGPALAGLARGEDAREVEPYREAKSYGEENTFGRDVSDAETLRSAIRAHAESIAQRLRRDQVRGRGVMLKLKLARSLGGGRFPLLTRSRSLQRATDDGRAIAEAALHLLERSGLCEPVRLVGVAVSGLEPARESTLSLFPDAEAERRGRLNHALDAIRDRFGAEAVQLAGARPERAGLTVPVVSGREPAS